MISTYHAQLFSKVGRPWTSYSLSDGCSSMVFDLGHQGTVEVAEEEAGQGGEGTGQGGGRKF